MAENRRPSQRYLSGRVKVSKNAGLGTDRHLYLSPSDAEPNLGYPGEKSVPISGTYYRLITIPNGNTYDRYWQVDSQASLVDGIVTYDDFPLNLANDSILSNSTDILFYGFCRRVNIYNAI